MVERDLSGSTVGGKFYLIKRLPSGGGGVVYLADQPNLKRQVIVKVTHPNHEGASLERFHLEAQVASRFVHSYAAHVYDFGIEQGGELDGLRWIAMELVPGITLREHIQKHGPMSLEDWVPLFMKIATVVQKAHDEGIIHRDLKPDNIMVVAHRGELIPKLLDFGIAKVDHSAMFAEDHLPRDYSATLQIRGSRALPPAAQITPPNERRFDLTPSGAIYGSPQYMSPEQIIDSGKVTPVSDIYALGLVTYEVLTGRVPFSGEDSRSCMEQHLRAEVPPLGDAFPPALDKVVRTALAKSPEDRQCDVLEFASQLRAVWRETDREKLRVAAQLWASQKHRRALLLVGSELQRWPIATSTELAQLECSFVAASHRNARRRAKIRRATPLFVLILMVAGGFLRSHIIEQAEAEHAQAAQHAAEERAQLAKQTSEQIAVASEIEQGRQALLHGESSEAVRHLLEARRRGERSPDVDFMLARALQPQLSELARVQSNSGHMWSAMFAPDDKRILTTDDKKAQMWDAASGQLLFTMSHDDAVYRAAFSRDGSRIITAGGDGTVGIWSSSTGTLIRKLSYYDEANKTRWRYSTLALTPRFVAAGDVKGRAVHVWDAETGSRLAQLPNDASEGPVLAISPNGRWLVSSGGQEIRIFDTATWRRVGTIPGPRIRSVSFDPRSRVVIGTADGFVSIWEIPSGVRVQSLRAGGASVDAVAFSADGVRVAAGSRDGTEQVWDARSGALLAQFNSHHDKIYAMEFARDHDRILSAGADGAVAISSIATGPVTRLEGPKKLIYAAHFDADSRRVVGASWDGTARVWDAAPPYLRWISQEVGPECDTADSLVPDERFIAISCRSLTRVWDTARGVQLAELPAVSAVEGDYYSALPALTANGDRAAIARGNVVEVYALPSGQLLQTVAHPAAVNAVAFAPSGHNLVSGAVDGSLLLTRDNSRPIALPSSGAGIDAVGILADGRVAATDASARLRLISPEKNALLLDTATLSRVRLLRLSPDNKRLVTIPTRNKQVPELLDLTRNRLVARLEGHIGRVFTARFDATGREILTTGADGSVLRWNAATGVLLQRFQGDSHFLTDAVLSPDRTMVVAGGSDGSVRFWSANGRLLWKLPTHRSYVIGVHYEDGDLVTRGFAGDVARWTLPAPDKVITGLELQHTPEGAMAEKTAEQRTAPRGTMP